MGRTAAASAGGLQVETWVRLMGIIGRAERLVVKGMGKA